MEHMTIPYDEAEIRSEKIQTRLRFITSIEQKALHHRFIDHELFLGLQGGVYTKAFVDLFMAQYSKHISVFTKALANLLGATNDLESRYMLFDNFYEEMGMGQFEECHYNLYCSMLETMGIGKLELENLPQAPSIDNLNDGLFSATNDVVAGLTWLGIGGEQTIPNHFPCMRAAVEQYYGTEGIDWRFFERHGKRDQMHADDAKLVLAFNMKDGDEARIVAESDKCLHLRAAACDEFVAVARNHPDLYLTPVAAQ